jgi:hypothetical protein
VARAPDPHAEQIARLRREHDKKMADIACQEAADLAKERRRVEERIAAIHLQHDLQREERGRERLAKDRVEVARRHGDIQVYRSLGLPLHRSARQALQDAVMEDPSLHANDQAVAQIRAFVYATAAREQIHVLECCAPELKNASAIRKLREIHIAPIATPAAAAAAIHELGHILHLPLPPDSKEALTDGWMGRCNVDAEIAAWQWVLTNTPAWTAPMHRRMVEALDSYRPFATSEQCVQIDRLSRRTVLQETRLRLAMKGAR